MRVELVEINNNNGELFFDIYDQDTKSKIGILFTVLDHVAYEIKPEYRRQGAATEALKLILEKIEKPVLEITFANIPSIKVAQKVGFSLKRVEGEFGIYEYDALKR